MTQSYFSLKDGNTTQISNKDIQFVKIEHLNHTYTVYTGVYDQLSTLDKLIRAGVTTHPIIKPHDLSKYRDNFRNTINKFQEYKPGQNIAYVINKSGNFGNPSSFHNPFVRDLRKLAYERVNSLFKKYVSLNPNYKNKKVYLQVLADRMMLRPIGQTPQRESWHRDVIPQKQITGDDDLFGGWINLDDEDQHFICITGSHLNVKLSNLDPGFAEIETSLHKKLKNDSSIKDKTKKALKSIEKYSMKIKIPPGHIVIFPQYILHSVASSKAKYEMFRLFTGWKLTTSLGTTVPAATYPKQLFDDQAPIRLPGGMMPSMYTGNHARFFLNRPFQVYPGIKKTLIEWANDTFVETVLVERKDKKTGKPYKIVPKDMKSLKEYNFKLYKPYYKEEWSIYKGKLL